MGRKATRHQNVVHLARVMMMISKMMTKRPSITLNFSLDAWPGFCQSTISATFLLYHLYHWGIPTIRKTLTTSLSAEASYHSFLFKLGSLSCTWVQTDHLGQCQPWPSFTSFFPCKCFCINTLITTLFLITHVIFQFANICTEKKQCYAWKVGCDFVLDSSTHWYFSVVVLTDGWSLH